MRTVEVHPKSKARKKSNDGLSFIHSSLDDYGLTAEQFRIYCHAARRAGTRGNCTASVADFIEHCGLCDKTIKKHLGFLVAQQLLAVRRKPGLTNTYGLRPPDHWKPNPGKPVPRVTPPNHYPGTPPNGYSGDPGKPVPPKGTPYKVTPSKERPAPRERWKIQGDLESVTEQIDRAKQDRVTWTDNFGCVRPGDELKPEAKQRLGNLRKERERLQAELDRLVS